MKIFLRILCISICIMIPIKKLDAKDTKFIKNNFYEGTIKWKGTKLNLPAGKWEHIRQSSWWYGDFGFLCKNFILTEDKIFKSLMSMCTIKTGGKYLSYLSAILNKHYKRGKYDSCVLRPEYYYAKLYIKGTTSNCLRIRHFDYEKELNYPDDPEDVGGLRPVLRKYVKDNNIIVPKILLSAVHEYFAPVVRDNGPAVYFLINPEAYGGPKEKFFTEESSEYHRANINNHPKFKKFIDEFTSLSAKRHKEFETQWKARDYHRLDLSDLKIQENDMALIKSESNIVKQIKDLKELYDSEVINKEEFEKAKNKILNQ